MPLIPLAVLVSAAIFSISLSLPVPTATRASPPLAPAIVTGITITSRRGAMPFPVVVLVSA